jgi:hypothetical protein
MGTEHEIVNDQRTGRTRRAQFMPTLRLLAVPPSKRTAMPFTSDVRSEPIGGQK